MPDTEWWSTDTVEFLCRRSCWLTAEGYTFDRQKQRQVLRGTLNPRYAVDNEQEPGNEES